MNEEIQIGNIKFWVSERIIYCEIYEAFDEGIGSKVIEGIFSEAISRLSDGKYMPILINMKKLSYFTSIRLFKFLSSNFIIKTLVLSKTFLVSSYALKVYLRIYNFISLPVIPNTLFIDYNAAIKNCYQNYRLVNAIVFK